MRRQTKLTTVIEHRINKTIAAAARRPQEISSVEDGLLLECPVCDMVHKVCLTDPEYLCERVVKEDTTLKENEMLLRGIKAGKDERCELCGRIIGEKQLRDHPNTGLCARCFSPIKKKSKSLARKSVRRK